MTKREFVALTLAVAGVYVVFLLINMAMQIFGMPFRHDEFLHFVLRVMSCLCGLFLAILIVFALFRFSDVLARRVVPDHTDTRLTGAAPADVHAVAFSVLGAVICAITLPVLLVGVVNVLAPLDYGDSAPAIRDSGVRRLAGQVIKMLMGVLLFVKSRALARWWRRLQKGDDGDAHGSASLEADREDPTS